MTHFRHWKTGSTGLWFPQIKVSPMTVPAYSLESFQAMAWGGRWWGGLRVHQSHIQETNQSSRKPNGQEWGRALKKRDSPAKQELWSGRHQSPTECWATCVWTPTPGTRKRQQKAASQITPELTRLRITHSAPTSRKWETSCHREHHVLTSP